MFQVGDKVMVTVSKPSFGWGSVSPNEVGKIIHMKKGSEIVLISFPSHGSWSGLKSEIALVDSEQSKKMDSVRYQPII